MAVLVATVSMVPSSIMISSAPLEFSVVVKVRVGVGGPSMCGTADRVDEEMVVIESTATLLVAAVSMMAAMATRMQILARCSPGVSMQGSPSGNSGALMPLVSLVWVGVDGTGLRGVRRQIGCELQPEIGSIFSVGNIRPGFVS